MPSAFCFHAVGVWAGVGEKVMVWPERSPSASYCGSRSRPRSRDSGGGSQSKVTRPRHEMLFYIRRSALGQCVKICRIKVIGWNSENPIVFPELRPPLWSFSKIESLVPGRITKPPKTSTLCSLPHRRYLLWSGGPINLAIPHRRRYLLPLATRPRMDGLPHIGIRMVLLHQIDEQVLGNLTAQP